MEIQEKTVLTGVLKRVGSFSKIYTGQVFSQVSQDFSQESVKESEKSNQRLWMFFFMSLTASRRLSSLVMVLVRVSTP